MRCELDDDRIIVAALGEEYAAIVPRACAANHCTAKACADELLLLSIVEKLLDRSGSGVDSWGEDWRVG